MTTFLSNKQVESLKRHIDTITQNFKSNPIKIDQEIKINTLGIDNSNVSELRRYLNTLSKESKAMKEKIYFASYDEDVIIPSKKDENAGMDIYAYFEDTSVIFNPNETKMIPTGLYSACSEDFYFQLFERGSTGTKGMGQRCGVIDSGYRGEWFIPITNHNNKPLIITKETDIEHLQDDYIVYPYSKAICQAVLLPVPKVEINVIGYQELMDMKSERMNSCLGQSGK